MTFGSEAPSAGRDMAVDESSTGFTATTVELELPQGLARVRVEADALQFWWGAESGPQTAHGLIDEHRAEIEAVATAKIARGAVESDGTVIVGDEDFE
ncbi:DUF1488 family protein [Sphingomonas crocodyli]|jgi:hypothetical protein|uniref:DUF1488 family protein n=1 Tax=Sphingomonas crocodyli TaxID=1979270 RepID=A0A437LYE1_9SPHN|nr:DUF1488 family protein [Sphingomonas crocodyli]RVT90385.1 DUF1488 family protein [Sphingomonas crocodyli]